MTGWLVVGMILLAGASAQASVEEWRGDRPLADQIRAIAHQAAERYLRSGQPWHPDPRAYDPRLRQAGAVFVTYSREGRTRGCWGALRPRCASLAEEIALSASQALRQDYRHRPIGLAEWKTLETTVSLIGRLESVADPSELSPTRHGLWLVGRGQGGIVLPGETRTVARMLYECRRKAGLRPQDPCTLTRFTTLQVGPASEAR